MARQNLSIGSVANDKSGDTLRQAGDKINDTFVELYKFLGGDSDVLPPSFNLDSGGNITIEKGAGIATLSAVNLTADRTAFLPDLSGNIILDSGEQTLSSKTLISPTINNPIIGTGINDSDGELLIAFTPASSAVNYITLTNAGAGNDVNISATGGDTDFNLVVAAAGTGSVELSKGAFSAAEISSNGTASALASYIICNKATALTVSLANGTTVGEYKIFTNKGAGNAVITPSNFAQGTNITLAQGDAVTLIWDGSNWYITGHYGAAIA